MLIWLLRGYQEEECPRSAYLTTHLPLCAADIISAVEFDYDGLHLATGDRGGRVVLFERVNPHVVSDQRVLLFSFRPR